VATRASSALADSASSIKHWGVILASASGKAPACDDIPRYLQTHYWWAYVHPLSVRRFERQWLVNLILWGNYARLCDAALTELGETLPGRTLQVACVYGDLTNRVGQRAAVAGGTLDIGNGLKRGENNIPFWDDVKLSTQAPLADQLMMIEAFENPLRFRFDLVGEEVTRRYGATIASNFTDEVHLHPPIDRVTDQCQATIEQRVATYFRHTAGVPVIPASSCHYGVTAILKC
jgi:hypothetical protein